MPLGRKHTHAYGMHAAGHGSANFAIAQNANRVECRRTASLWAVRLGCTLLDLEGTKAGHAKVQSTIGTREK